MAGRADAASERDYAGVLGAQAIQALQTALDRHPAPSESLREERSIRQPDSWLAERCWTVLAQAGATEGALVLASLMAHRQPLAVPKALLALAERAEAQDATGRFVRKRLSQHAFGTLQSQTADRQAFAAALLLTAAAAAKVELPALVFSCLERLDQMPGAWRSIMSVPDQRPVLAAALAAVEMHPLSRQLIDRSLERFAADGALFLNELTLHLVNAQGETEGPRARLMDRCLQAVSRFASGDVTARRYATSVLARAGQSRAVLDSVNTLAAVLDAQQETAGPVRDADDNILRHVVRKNANMNADFQVFTLQEALRALPATQRRGADAQVMAERLAHLASQSDGWTASSAVTALVDTGWFDVARAMVERISPADVARSEAVCILVQGLLAQAHYDAADAQVRNAWPWLQALDDEHVKWLTLRRWAEAYAQAGQPQRAQSLLTPRPSRNLLRRWFGAKTKAPEERTLSETRVRLLCLLADPDAAGGNEEKALMRRLATRARALLSGEALAAFYLELLPPLIAAQRWVYVTNLLPGISQALWRIKGQKHAVRTREFARHLTAGLASIAHEHRAWLAQELQQWVSAFWLQGPQEGVWQVVYRIDGCLELVQALEGAQPLLAIGRFAQRANRNLAWGRAVDAAVQEMIEKI